jgi:hypothetical protein
MNLRETIYNHWLVLLFYEGTGVIEMLVMLQEEGRQ